MHAVPSSTTSKQSAWIFDLSLLQPETGEAVAPAMSVALQRCGCRADIDRADPTFCPVRKTSDHSSFGIADMKCESTATIVGAGTADELTRYDHDSFATARVRRVILNGRRSLFGSSLRHGNHVVVELSRAHLERRQGIERIVEDELIVRLAMSNDQWASFVSSVGNGSGTPITLEMAPRPGTRWESMPELAAEPTRSANDDQVIKAAAAAAKGIIEVQEALGTFLQPGSKGPNKKGLTEIIEMLDRAGEKLDGELDPIRQSFVEAMDRTVDRAKLDIEGFASSVAASTGLERLMAGQVAPALMDSTASSNNTDAT